MNNTETGAKGEKIASEYLTQLGYSILENNWRFKRCEVDIIAKENNTLVFVEVKTRTNTKFGLPEEAVAKPKQKQLIQAADEYIFQQNHKGEIRFDVIAIQLVKIQNHNILHIKDAFFGFQDY